MDIKTILGSAVIAAIFSSLISYIISRQQNNLQYVTGEREKWREKIREIASKLNDATYYDTLDILTLLKVRINAFGSNKDVKTYSNDAHIWSLIEKIEKGMIAQEILKLQQKLMIRYLSLLLKYDWERSKKEVKGNIHNILSCFCFVISGIYFIVSLFINYREEEKIYISAISILYVFLVVVGVYIIVQSVQTIFTKILACKIIDKPKYYKRNRLTFCYGILSATILLLFGIYFGILIFSMSWLKNKSYNLLIITEALSIYAIGLIIQYFPRTLNFVEEYVYNNTINQLRSEYVEKEKEVIVMLYMPNKNEKFNDIYSSMENKYDIKEFISSFKNKYEIDCNRINNEFNTIEKEGRNYTLNKYLEDMYTQGITELNKKL